MHLRRFCDFIGNSLNFFRPAIPFSQTYHRYPLDSRSLCMSDRSRTYCMHHRWRSEVELCQIARWLAALGVWKSCPDTWGHWREESERLVRLYSFAKRFGGLTWRPQVGANRRYHHRIYTNDPSRIPWRTRGDLCVY